MEEKEITEVIISSYKRSKTKGKREADLDGLPARVFNHELSEEEPPDPEASAGSVTGLSCAAEGLADG